VLAAVSVDAIDNPLDVVLAHAAFAVTARQAASTGFNHEVAERVELYRSVRMSEISPARGSWTLPRAPGESNFGREVVDSSEIGAAHSYGATSATLDLDALVGTPRAFLDDGRLIDLAHSYVRDLSSRRRVRSAGDLPLPGLVRDTVADLELHRENPRRGRSRRRIRRVRQRRLRAAVLLALLLSALRHAPPVA